MKNKPLPRWARLGAVLGVVLLAVGIALFSYRYATRPVTLTVAAGSIDGDAVRVLSAIASRLASSNSRIRLKVIDSGTALGAAQAFSSGQADLAIVRSDLGDLSSARTVALLTHAVVFLIAPPGSPVKKIEDLKRRTLGVIGGPINRHIAELLSKEFDLGLAPAQIKDDLKLDDIRQAIQGKQVQALLAVVPISERYIAGLRSLVPPDGKRQPTLLAIESAEAIANVAKVYDSYELPKGTFRGAPAIPDDDLTTLRVPVHLVAKSSLDNETVATIAKGIMESRRELIGEYHVMSQISAPSTDKDANIPIHPGAKIYFEGEEKSFFDKYGDQLFYSILILGSLTSALAAVWKFVAAGPTEPGGRPVDRLHDLAARVRSARSEDELKAIEDELDTILRDELDGLDGAQETAFNIALARLDRLIYLQLGRVGTTMQPSQTAAK
jgi:TRAP-type uncharacterized transport system substrate-binding protein